MIRAFSEPISLFKCEAETNEVGKLKQRIINRSEVLAMVESVSRNEFYQSNANGIKVSKVIKIQAFLYDEEKFLKVGVGIYKVIRTYEQTNLIELYLEKTNLKEVDGWLV